MSNRFWWHEDHVDTKVAEEMDREWQACLAKAKTREERDIPTMVNRFVLLEHLKQLVIEIRCADESIDYRDLKWMIEDVVMTFDQDTPT